MLRNTFKKVYTEMDTKYRPQAGSDQEPVIPEGLWRKCNKCGQPICVEDVKNNYYVCPKCNDYLRVHAYYRIGMLADGGASKEWSKEMPFSNPLNFPGCEKEILAARKKSRLDEAIVTGRCKIDGNPVIVGVCDARFIMSSMGYIVDEKIIDTIERITKEETPVILFACSDEAEIQEGTVSLMQTAKTSAILERHHKAGRLFISVFTNLTTGGVMTSSATLSDIIPAEPHALISFVGPRATEQTIGQKLPGGFQRSESLLEHGFVDRIAERKDQKGIIGRTLYMYRGHKMNIGSKSPAETVRTFVDKPSESQEDGGKIT